VSGERSVAHSDPGSKPLEAGQQEISWYQISVAAALLALIGATYRLWFPSGDFPLVPMFGFLTDVPAWVDYVVASGIVISAAAVISQSGNRSIRSCLWIFIAVLLVASFLLNQHRLQPWAYQFVILSAIFAWSSPSREVSLARILALGIYFFSAIAKLNSSFVDELGKDLLLTIGQLAGVWKIARDVEAFTSLSLLFPICELCVFSLLVIPNTRRVGVIAAIFMHVGLLAMLGPLGLNHSLGVLLWNLFFIAQVFFLFWPRHNAIANASLATVEVHPTPSRWSPALVAALIGSLVVPLGDWIGLSDPWPAWALYDSRVGRTSCFVSRFAVRQFPEPWHQYVALETIDQDYVQFDTNQWSLERTAAPIYPGSRFSFAVASAMAEKSDTTRFVRLVVQHPADRFSGERESVVVPGNEAANYAVRNFWLNIKPRTWYLAHENP